MKFTNFHEVSFRQSVDEALKSVEKILHLNRHPRLAEDVEHSYNNKYELANLLTNVAIISHVNALERMGLTMDILKTIDTTDNKSTILRFQASDSKDFKTSEVVKVSASQIAGQSERGSEGGGGSGGGGSSGILGFGQKSSIRGVMTNVTEYHWNFSLSWELILFTGVDSSTGHRDDEKNLLKRETTMLLKTQTEDPSASLFPQNSHPAVDLDLTWLLKHIDPHNCTAHFKINTHDDIQTRTPRRNVQMDDAMDFFFLFKEWVVRCSNYFQDHIDDMISSHDPATEEVNMAPFATLKSISADDVFVPIQPLMEDPKDKKNNTSEGAGDEQQQQESRSILNIMAGDKESKEDDNNNNNVGNPLLSNQDMNQMLNEQIRTIGVATDHIVKLFSSPHVKLVSVAEATFVLLCKHIGSLATAYTDGIEFIENMLKKQLIAAIGKTLSVDDLDKFIKHQNSCILKNPPQQFCHPIRRPKHYPDGILSIESINVESKKMEPIETMCRKVVTQQQSEEQQEPFRVPLNAGVTMELMGDVYLHGWLQHSFQAINPKSYKLVARARQFSSFILVIGNLVGPHRLDPKDAIILQNKDEVLIPLLLSDIPTPKEFTDSIHSLSPEQQRFAKAFRSMQLSSSVFGLCVIQMKPQLETLLGLPQDALTKEMKLTQDLIELFAEYQIPSDVLSYDGPEEGENSKEKVANVKEHVRGVLEVIEENKKKQLEEQQRLAAEAGMAAIQEDEDDEEDDEFDNKSTSLFSVLGEKAVQDQANFHIVAPRGVDSQILTDESNSREVRTSFLVQGMLANKEDIPDESSNHDESEAPWLLASNEPIVFNLMSPYSARNANQHHRSLLGGGEGDNGTGPSSSAEQGGGGDSSAIVGAGDSGSSMNFTLIPRIIDQAMEQHDTSNAIRATILNTSDTWTRKRQANLLTKPATSTLSVDDVQSEKQKAFDVLDALCRSGTLPIPCSELHVIVSVTHSFENDVMGSVIQDNINPIEKLEQSALLFASAIHGVPVKDVIHENDDSLRERLTTSFPKLLSPQSEEDDNNGGES